MNIITKHLPSIEKVFLAAFIIGAILRVMHIDSSVIKVALLGLGVIFFLYAYRPTERPTPEPENEKSGFQGLLVSIIIPKILWISSAISALGFAFFLFDFGNDSYKRLLTIGGSTIAGGIFMLVVSLVQGKKYPGTATPVLLRAVPLLVVDMFLLFN